MIELLVFVIWLAVTGGLALGGYVLTKRFVRDRLRYVDAVRRSGVPVLAGVLAALLAAPVAWILPVIGGGTAVLFGLSVGLGVSSGRREFKRLPGAW